MNKKEIIDKFLIAVFDQTLNADLKQMLSTSKGLDFAIILLICSGIELIGALDQGSLKYPEKRFGVTLSTYFPKRYNQYKNILYDYFRCGAAHQAFIKPGTATARNPDYQEYHLSGVIVKGEVLLFIHPNVFANDFFNAIEKFKDSFNEHPVKIDNAYKVIKKIYNNRLKAKEIEIYKELPDNPMSITQMPQPLWLEELDD